VPVGEEESIPLLLADLSPSADDNWPKKLPRIGILPLPSGANISNVGLFGHFKCVIDLNAQVPDRAFKLSVAQQ
jgi:hypothetical protein